MKKAEIKDINMMTDEELNEALAYEIKDFLLKYKIFNDTCIYFNDKRIRRNYETNRLVVEKNIDVTKYLKFCNPKTVSMSFEGDNSLYPIINWDVGNAKSIQKAEKLRGELSEIFRKYNRWYDVGYSWSIFSYRLDSNGRIIEE